MALRWIVIVLAVANLGYFAWGTFWHSSEDYRRNERSGALAQKYDQSLELLSERRDFVTLPSKPADKSEERVDQNDMCLLVGPFSSASNADQIQQKLFSLGVASKERFVGAGKWSEYWVHIPPLPSRGEAVRMLRELHAQSIDSYVITRGELTNGVSLGLFSQESLAEDVSRRLTALGYNPVIKKLGQKAESWWLELSVKEASALGAGFWEKLTHQFNDIKKIEKLCKSIASNNNFH